MLFRFATHLEYLKYSYGNLERKINVKWQFFRLKNLFSICIFKKIILQDLSKFNLTFLFSFILYFAFRGSYRVYVCVCVWIGTVRVAYQVVQGIVSTLSPDLNLASPGQDFVASNNSFVDLANGVTSASINIIIIDDLLPEIDEVFLVKLSSVSLVGSSDEMSPPRLSSEGTTAEVRINANDGVQGVIMFATDSRR